MKVKSILSLFVAIVMAGTLQAQGFGGFIQRATNAVSGSSSSSSQSSSQSSSSSSQSSSSSSSQTSSAAAQAGSGKIYYVSKNGASRGADGLSVATAKKDIQAVLDIIKDNNENGAVVRVSEGNFLGRTNAGYIEISNFITLEGGWNEDFTQRDPLKYITRIQPTQDQL